MPTTNPFMKAMRRRGLTAVDAHRMFAAICETEGVEPPSESAIRNWMHGQRPRESHAALFLREFFQLDAVEIAAAWGLELDPAFVERVEAEVARHIQAEGGRRNVVVYIGEPLEYDQIEAIKALIRTMQARRGDPSSPASPDC